MESAGGRWPDKSPVTQGRGPRTHNPMQLHIAINGQRQGPMSLEELNARLADGRIEAVPTLAWYEGCPEWIPLSQVPGIMVPGGIAEVPPPTQGAAAPTTEGPGTPPAAPSADTLSSVIPYRNPMALVAYYLGIFSLIPVLGAILALPAILLGVLGLGRSRRNAQAKGKAHAWVGITAGLLSIIGHLVALTLLRS